MSHLAAQNYILFAALMTGALATVLTRDLVRAAIALAFTSMVLTMIIYRLGAPWAAVFELSVCAGLITVIFIGAISLVRPATEQEKRDELASKVRRYLPLFVLLLGVGLVLGAGRPADLPLPPAADPEDFRRVLWTVRRLDLMGQIMVLLTGVWGVVVLFKEGRG
jgi:NADH-quinone oxidoreductase subunit J